MHKLSPYNDSYFKHREHPCSYCSTHQETELSQYLLKSSNITLRHCGRFLVDSAECYRVGNDGWAVHRAAASKLFLERSRYLEDRWREALTGVPLVIEEVKKALDTYLRNQTWRLQPIVQQFGQGRVPNLSEVVFDLALENAKVEVRQFLQEIIDDYRIRWSRVQSFDVLNETDPALAHAYLMMQSRLCLFLPPSLAQD